MSDPADATDAIIKAALAEEEQIKKQRKASKATQDQSTKAVKKGKTLAELEDEEGGPVKESLVGMAHTKRAAKRKGSSAAGDTDLIANVQHIEEDLHADEEDGVKFEAFNLKEERERGYFDAEGNYVEKDDDDEEEGEADAWLQSEAASVVDAETLEKIERRQKQLEQQEKETPEQLSAAQIARLQYQIAKMLQPGETVIDALRRLGGGANNVRHRRITKRAKHAVDAKNHQEPMTISKEDKEKLDQLTEAASNLLDVGEMDVYSRDKSYFQRAAAVYIDSDSDDNDGGTAGDKGILAAAKKSYADGGGGDDDDENAEDMFADEKEEEKKEEEEKKKDDVPDYSTWTIKDLRRYLTERGVDTSTIIEKSELIEKVQCVAAEPVDNKTSGSHIPKAPPGYAFDPGTGMWKSEESGMLWDSSTGAFYNSVDQKWYIYDKGWIECQ